MNKRTKNNMPWLMALLYFGAGINHFVHPGGYAKIIPEVLPDHLLLVYISGVCEVLFALLLLPIASRRLAAWLIILLLVAVFPANIQMSINYHMQNDPHLWLTLLRLPLQLLLIWWAWLYTKP